MEKTEMMKKYDAETDEIATWCWHDREFLTDDYIAWLEAKANISDEAIEAFRELIRNQCDEISALKEQLRWRLVSEKPERMGMYLAEVRPYMGNVDVIVTTVYFNGESFLGYDDVVRWLPIPPAPEGE